MYIEQKAGDLIGPSRIGRVTFSKTGKMIYYKEQKFQSLKGAGFKSNYYDIDTHDDYWISGPRKDRQDKLYGGKADFIDNDVWDEYWRDIRSLEPPKKIKEI